MYLENSEQGKVSGEGELSSKAILAEKCAVPKVKEASGLSSLSKTNTELSIKVLVEYTEKSVGREMDPPLLCLEHENLNTEDSESSTQSKGHPEPFKEYSTTNGFIESDQTLSDDTEGLNQLFDECTQHCECLKPSKSSEHCVNHSLASKGSPCCPEQLLIFLQCEPSDQHSESSEFESDELEGNCGCLGQSGMTDFIPECTEQMDLLQQYELSAQERDSFDLEQDGSTEESEQSFIHNISDSVDSLNCDAELYECDESQTQTEYTDDDDEEDEQYEVVQNDGELSDQEDTPEFTDVPFESDGSEMYLHTDEENFEQTSETDASTDAGELSGNDDSEYEPTQRCHSGKSVEFCPEEDGSSDGSSEETKSFKTCLDDSFRSDPCSDSEDFDKELQGDSSDDPMQWESLEEDNEEKPNMNFNTHDDEQKETSPVNVIEDFFDLFDSTDCYGHNSAQKRRYISCFDGGDIHDHLHLEEEVQRRCNQTVYKLEDEKEKTGVQNSEDTAEIHVQDNDVHSEDATFDNNVHSEVASELIVHDNDVHFNNATFDNDVYSEDASELIVYDDDDNYHDDDYDHDNNNDDGHSKDATSDTDEEDTYEPCESENQSHDWTTRSESSSTKDDTEEQESETLYTEDCEEAEDDEASVDGEAFVVEGPISDAHYKELVACLHSGNEEKMFAPFAREISVEGDAYEDEVSASKNCDSPGNAALTETSADLKEVRKEKADPGHNDFLACSEMEPYWAHTDQEKIGEFCELGVEDYYIYQIKSIQSSWNPSLNGVILDRHLNRKEVDEKFDENTFQNENKGTFSPLRDTESQDMEVCQEESKSVGFGITVVEQTPNQQRDNESELDEISAEISPPLDIIHSVVSKLANETTQNRDSDEEQSDDESIELCECEYCIPPTQQVLHTSVS